MFKRGKKLNEFDADWIVKFFTYFFIFFVAIISITTLTGILSDLAESDYDKCIGSCYGMRSQYKTSCVQECTNVLLIESDKFDDLIKMALEEK